MYLDFYLCVVLQALRGGLEAAQECATVSVGAVDEDDLQIVEVLEQFHPHICLVRVGRHSP